MSRKVQRVRYYLDPKDIKDLPEPDLRAILRGADDLVMQGGRNLLAKILKGSRVKKVLELGLDASPVYGYFKHLSEEEILARIDWVIAYNYLAIEYDSRLPLLRYTSFGWEIERKTYAEELLRGFDTMLATTGPPFDMSYLKDRQRDMILCLLDKVQASRDRKYIPLLEAWQQIDHRKVRERVGYVIKHLNSISI